MIEVGIERFPTTLELTLTCMSLSLTIPLVVGMYSSVRRSKWFAATGKLLLL